MTVLYDSGMAAQLEVGDKAPDFKLLDQAGKKVKLSSFRKDG
jgi:peroxiredoxin